MYECEKLDRNYIGFDINSEMISYINQKMVNTQNIDFFIGDCDVTDTEKMDVIINQDYKWCETNTVKKEDLSNISNLDVFINKLLLSIKNGLQYLKKDKYFATIIGDVYKKVKFYHLDFMLWMQLKKTLK